MMFIGKNHYVYALCLLLLIYSAYQYILFIYLIHNLDYNNWYNSLSSINQLYFNFLLKSLYLMLLLSIVTLFHRVSNPNSTNQDKKLLDIIIFFIFIIMEVGGIADILKSLI